MNDIGKLHALHPKDDVSLLGPPVTEHTVVQVVLLVRRKGEPLLHRSLEQPLPPLGVEAHRQQPLVGSVVGNWGTATAVPLTTGTKGHVPRTSEA